MGVWRAIYQNNCNLSFISEALQTRVSVVNDKQGRFQGSQIWSVFKQRRTVKIGGSIKKRKLSQTSKLNVDWEIRKMSIGGIYKFAEIGGEYALTYGVWRLLVYSTF